MEVRPYIRASVLNKLFCVISKLLTSYNLGPLAKVLSLTGPQEVTPVQDLRKMTKVSFCLMLT